MSGMPSVFNISRGNPDVVSATILTMIHPYKTLNLDLFKVRILVVLWIQTYLKPSNPNCQSVSTPIENS
jgi:hypothetical protein